MNGRLERTQDSQALGWEFKSPPRHQVPLIARSQPNQHRSGQHELPVLILWTRASFHAIITVGEAKPSRRHRGLAGTINPH